MDEPACPGCRELLQRVAALEARVAELTRKLEDALRAGKRQAAPFRKGPPKPDPKTPGRKSGAAHGTHGHRPPPPPDQIAECHDAHLPDACPHCPGRIVETGTADQFQTDIPRRPLVRKFRIHVGHCDTCGKRTQGRHPLQTSDALGAAASQVGPDAQAAAATLHTRMGLSHGKVAAVFDALFGITLTRGASAQINLRAATRLEPDYHLILGEVRTSEQIAADETGWRIGGHPAWLHAWVGDRATAYAIDSQRSAAVLERVIGVDWSGILSHDGFASYDRFEGAIHQQCVAHVLRRARDLLATATRGAVRFPRQVIALLTEAIHWRNGYAPGAWTSDQLEEHREGFDDRLRRLVLRPRAVPAHATLARHLWRHFEQWFGFVFDPRVEPTNWAAEQAIRPAVVNRKVWGGNRTAAGAWAQGVLMSVLETCRRRGHAVVDYISQTLRAAGNGLVPRPVLLPTG
ncbi:IS66 family transposase [Urbifossiella limnaea]|uniref:Transposase IS66 family protein n=1 Tax=Urbifossiella limnaea TaxID=2528023 RepID=A0A517XYX1_9BACT|nr:IS66 family transposase [Urbifossiella limnaea]QDU20463.1 Transposase IS66 family protein [Urbifossiella limnaea]QDU22716.1 Transposase IS66 family protein [Urbifossiella limnaea]